MAKSEDCTVIAGGDHYSNGADLPDKGTDTGLDVTPYGADIGSDAINRMGSLTVSSGSDASGAIRAETIVASGGARDNFATGSPFTADDGRQTQESTMPRASDIHR